MTLLKSIEFMVTKNAMVSRRVVLFKGLGLIWDLDLKLR